MPSSPPSVDTAPPGPPRTNDSESGEYGLRMLVVVTSTYNLVLQTQKASAVVLP